MVVKCASHHTLPTVQTHDAISYFGSVSALARVLGTERAAIYQWRDYPPPLRQYQLAELSAYHLKPEPDAQPPASRTWIDPDARAIARWHRACQLKRFQRPCEDLAPEFQQELEQRDVQRWERFQQRCVEQAQYRKSAEFRREFIKLRRIGEGKRRR